MRYEASYEKLGWWGWSWEVREVKGDKKDPFDLTYEGGALTAFGARLAVKSCIRDLKRKPKVYRETFR